MPHYWKSHATAQMSINDSSCCYIILVNTPGAELLYKKIAEWCNTSPETVVLDICCGTGTIGQTVAKVT